MESVDYTLCRPLKKALASNANSSSFASKISTLTEPTNDGVVPVGMSYGGIVPKTLLVLPYGLGSDNDVFDMRIIGWRRMGSGPSPGTFWVPTLLAGLTCTISAAVGVATAPVLNTERFADTITITAGMEATITAATTRGGFVWTFSPTSDLIAYALVELLGVEKVEFTFDQTTGTPTTNALISFI